MSEVRRWAHTVVWEGQQISATYMAINDGGEYVMHDDYAALEAELAKLRAELAAFKSAVDHVTADGKTTRSFSASEGWSMVHCDRLTDLHVAEERLSELERRESGEWKLAPVDPTPEMVSAAEEAYMPFGDMDIALRMAILAAPSAPKADDPVKVQLLEALTDSLELMETLCAFEGDTIRKARAAIAAARKGEGE